MILPDEEFPRNTSTIVSLAVGPLACIGEVSIPQRAEYSTISDELLALEFAFGAPTVLVQVDPDPPALRQWRDREAELLEQRRRVTVEAVRAMKVAAPRLSRPLRRSTAPMARRARAPRRVVRLAVRRAAAARAAPAPDPAPGRRGARHSADAHLAGGAL